LTIVAAPTYVERCGEPRSIAELESHTRLGFGYVRAIDGWPLVEDEKVNVVPTTSRVQASDGEALRRLALAGVGLARLASFTVREDIAAGRLSAVLESLNPGDTEAFHAVYVGQGGPLPSRVRVLLDFLTERARVN
jgi:DNA-binding transcriptional LysR family regulator